MAWNKLPKELRPKAPKLDAIDLEAERQGDAVRWFDKNEAGPRIMGRRISKQTRQLDGRRKTADAKATANLVADTAAVAARVIIPNRDLVQRPR
jgi:hypothetical protein